jgi:transcription factor IIIB subunit 2
LRPTAASLGITPVVESNDNKSDAIVAEDVNESDELDLTGIDDEELDAYLLNVDEIDAKTNVWTRVHAEYLEEMKQKEEVKAREEEERKRKEASGEVQPKKKRKTRKKTQIQANSASEAIEKMLQEKKISNKINYDVLKNLNPSFGEKIQFKTPDIPIKEDLKIESQEQKLNSPLKT